VRLEFETIALDAEVDPGAFRSRAPPGARVERVAGEGEGT
jgi:hypothetical protein